MYVNMFEKWNHIHNISNFFKSHTNLNKWWDIRKHSQVIDETASLDVNKIITENVDSINNMNNNNSLCLFKLSSEFELESLS